MIAPCVSSEIGVVVVGGEVCASTAGFCGIYGAVCS